ncbi:MAG TPA: anaerobic ribonucleoside-triphosphate reductase activating protein [Clostridia bacterium]|nr:anaerobic ribonucleoside-triphosphate reductase activating protein [Clostridia bacterium]
MKIGGIQKSSLIDYPEHISAVIFTVGCNMNCFYCHNKRLLRAFDPEELILEEEVLKFLKKRQGLLDGVVISGGEPTLYSDLPDFIQKVKQLGYDVKLDTNGANPDMIKKVIDKIDFIAMDIKAPFERYEEFCGVRDMPERIKKSIEIIVSSGKPYQFRTTMAPGLERKDAEIIKTYIPDTSRYVEQKYRKPPEF